MIYLYQYEKRKGTIMKYYLGIDLGASSGRHIVGYYDENNKLILDEV